MDKICKVKIAGPSRIPLPNYLGDVREERVINFWNSSKIVIDLGGKDILDLAANGIFCISTIENLLFPCLTINDLDSQFNSFLSNKKARDKIAKKAKENVLKSDTTYHRILDITENLGLNSYAEKIKAKIGELS